MKLTKSETEKLTIALFKLGRMKPTLEIGEMANKLADALEAEEARLAAIERAKTETTLPQLPLESAGKK